MGYVFKGDKKYKWTGCRFKKQANKSGKSHSIDSMNSFDTIKKNKHNINNKATIATTTKKCAYKFFTLQDFSHLLVNYKNQEIFQMQ